VGRPGPLVLRPWLRLSVLGEDPKTGAVGSQTLAVSDRRRLDILGGYPVRFDYRRGEKKGERVFGRTKPPLIHTRCSPQIRGKKCSIWRPYNTLSAGRGGRGLALCQPIQGPDARSVVCCAGQVSPDLSQGALLHNELRG